MKRFALTLAILMTLSTAHAASSSRAEWVHVMSCSEVGAPMFDAVVVNIDQSAPQTGRVDLLLASVYHRVEQGTVLVTRTPVSERQQPIPGAPKIFIGKDVRLEVQIDVAPSIKGFPAHFELRSPGLQTRIEMNCQLVNDRP